MTTSRMRRVGAPQRDEANLSLLCILVTPKRKIVGHLKVMKNSLQFYVEFVIVRTGESCVFNG